MIALERPLRALCAALQPLTEPDAAELVRVVVGPVDDLTLRELWTRSDGNPLYLRELLAALEVLVVAESLGLAHAQRLGMLEVFTDLEQSALVRVDKDGRRELLRISHPIYGEVLRTRIGSLAAASSRAHWPTGRRRSGPAAATTSCGSRSGSWIPEARATAMAGNCLRSFT